MVFQGEEKVAVCKMSVTPTVVPEPIESVNMIRRYVQLVAADAIKAVS